MKLLKEIKRAVELINFNAFADEKIANEQIESKVNETIENLKNENYDFSTYNSIVLKQASKIRYVKLYDTFTTENILCQYIKQILDRQLKIKYPNRNKTIHTLFDFLKAVKQMSEFTIIKYDFKDYFNSVSSVYVYEKYIKDKITDRAEEKLVSSFSKQTKYAYAGLNTSNLFSEVIAIKFDERIRQAFLGYGLIFLERYIDDTIIILNKNLEQSVCNKILQDTLRDIYYDEKITVTIPCKTKFNSSKFKMITKRSLNSLQSSISFLGYEFFFNKEQDGKIKIQYGITAEKQDKYNRRVDEILKDYKLTNDAELLRHRILAFSSRIVYVRRKYNNNIWKVKGLINNYGELRFFIDTPLLNDGTKKFLSEMIINAFTRNKLKLPNFMQNSQKQQGYNLLKNMEVNKTLLLVDHIGYDKVGIKKLCTQIGITVNDKGYDSMVREYLMKIKLG